MENTGNSVAVEILPANPKKSFTLLNNRLEAAPLASRGSVFQELGNGKKWPKTIPRHKSGNKIA